ncbi:MAG: hypothetical protein R6X16_07800 [Anaerolineae bacterium]
MTPEPTPEQRILEMAVAQVERSMEERRQQPDASPEERAKYEAAQERLRAFAGGPDSTAGQLVETAATVSRWVRWAKLALFLAVALIVALIFLLIR